MNQAAFESFAFNLIKTIADTLKALDKQHDPETVMQKAQNIEPFVIEYLLFLAQQHDAKGYASRVQEIEEEIGKGNHSKPYTAKYMKRLTFALWTYCRESAILDSAGSRLFSILEYDPDYREILISSLKPVMDKLYENKESHHE